MIKKHFSRKLESKLNHGALLRIILSGSALPYALYGGGNCASEILSFLETNNLPLPKLIFDRNPAVHELHGIPLVKPAKEKIAGISTILLATEVWQDSMKKDITAVFGDNISILDILRINRTARKLLPHPLSAMKDLDKGALNIAVRCDGGLGDVINVSAWLKEFRKLFSCPVRIDVFIHSHIEGVAIFEKTGFVSNIFSEHNFLKRQENYDLAFVATWTILVTHFNEKRAIKFDNRLAGFVSKFKTYWQENERYLRFENLHMLMRLCVYRGIDRWGLLGSSNVFPFDQNTRPFLPIPDSALSCVEKFGLDKHPYIVIGSGSTTTYKFSRMPVRSWPEEKWSALVKLLKAKYPSFRIVQVGAGQKLSHVSEVDTDLAGLTSIEELKVILKNAIYLIDYDSGTIHINNAVGGKSAVLFGSSFKYFIGYDQNVNISANVCQECIWILPDWPEHCALEQDPPKCMNSITPEMVMEYIEPELNNLTKSILHRLDGCSGNPNDLRLKIMNILTSNVDSIRQTAVCGNAFTSILPTMADAGFSTVFYTINPTALVKKWGAFSNPGLSIEFGAPLSLPAHSSSFDAVLCQVDPTWSALKIEHVKKEAARILRLDGILLLLEIESKLAPSLSVFKKEEEALLQPSTFEVEAACVNA